jgi:hypothetical protein
LFFTYSNFRGIFKTKASKVEKAFKSFSDSFDISVSINKDKPQKGSFIVNVSELEETTSVIELLELTRPFKKLRELDVEAVIKDFVSNLLL